MSHPFVRLPAFALCACALALTWVVGCNPPNGATADVHDHDHEHDHDDHGHADTYAGAVEEIENYAAQIKEAFAAGTPAESDDALHELGHVMLDLADLAKRAGATGTNLEEIEADIDKAMDAYGTLDKAIHNDDFDAA